MVLPEPYFSLSDSRDTISRVVRLGSFQNLYLSFAIVEITHGVTANRDDNNNQTKSTNVRLQKLSIIFGKAEGPYYFFFHTVVMTQGNSSQKYIVFSTWDLKGGELNSIIHQCFFTSGALYLLVWDIRDGSEGVEKLRPWLLNIQVN